MRVRTGQLSPKIFSRCVDLKHEVFEKPDFGPKTGSGNPGHPGDIKDMRDHYKFTFLVYLYNGLIEICKTGHFRAKPDPGLILSGKIFLPKKFL